MLGYTHRKKGPKKGGVYPTLIHRGTVKKINMKSVPLSRFFR